jgi:hypothetical protein
MPTHRDMGPVYLGEAVLGRRFNLARSNTKSLII